jgi:hypothetical protein
MSALIEIEPTHLTSTGQRYRVWHDGEVLIESTKNAFHDAARALSAKGVTGRLEMKRKGSDRIDLRGLIAVLATRTISETEKHGPKPVKWVPHFMAGASA